MKQAINLFWFRRDLRLEDNAGLFHALSAGLPVLPVFIFDKNILDELEDRADKRVRFIYNVLCNIREKLKRTGSDLFVAYDYPEDFFRKLICKYEIKTVFANHDYEPYARKRDGGIKQLLTESGIDFKTYKDQVVFEKDEIAKNDGGYYTVYTPYSKKWLENVPGALPFFHGEKLQGRFLKNTFPGFPSLESMRFENVETESIHFNIDKGIIESYDKTRNIPGVKGTSRLGIHLRFGTLSIRQLVAKVEKWNAAFLRELIWREFFMQLLWHKPEVVGHCCKPEYENIEWRNSQKEFERWCRGETGYPIVDAGMRELNETGFMHNRVRMVTASFLVKHLLIDWRWGEAYFAKKLLDYELSSNNGNWQWVASCGCDAAPYFRIFNPLAQVKKFDPDEKYIRQWLPEYGSANYPSPIVHHIAARERCLATYKKALSQTPSRVIQTNLFHSAGL